MLYRPSLSKSKKLSKPKKKKPTLQLVPQIVRQNSNLSEDSNDPKRRHKIVGTFDASALSNLNLMNRNVPVFGQSINEEPFHSDDDLSKDSEDTKSKENKPKEASIDAKASLNNTNKNNTFFIHKRVKNSRQSILADRPLTIFKSATKNNKQTSRFFSPAAMKSKRLEQLKLNESQAHLNSARDESSSSKKAIANFRKIKPKFKTTSSKKEQMFKSI